ncbi:MAG: hypothetical protein D6691_12240 [Candidatus Hydrogenedentota bacterium]|jgi:hypothetical protein|uniref:Glycosyltransferase RgtA/B/C/D-like domain-containing protein n=1 Tax=Sumerlaea chitinivorans TaxID=2250252 RepID=A0A2Z4Y7Z8_SUMC1|nr:hypothetical protein BRCON_2632 [Candidatus Sumerlaea chitinivorans]RMH24075.1 MAG: hypothetical protein D6691_12240 [Candidatus Hydrogenedentota bacterium]GIX43746.1 MAG: hypothetical protein KatS3mg130_0154 [Candidatus Sumerlaea sp.]
MKQISRENFTVFFAFALLYLAVAGGHLYSPDEEIMFRVTESLATRARLDIEPIAVPGRGTFATKAGVNGREYAQYGIANSLFAVPFYWLGDFVGRMLGDEICRRLFDFRTTHYVLEPTGRGLALARRFGVSLFGIFVAAATCALLWRLVAHRLAPACFRAREGPALDPPQWRMANRAAWLTTLAYGAGTMALPHSRTFFSEPLATFFVLLSFYCLATSEILGLKRAFWAGIAFAGALLTRLDSVVVLPAVVATMGLVLLDTPGLPLRMRLRQPAASVIRLLISPRALTAYVAFCIGPLLFACLQAYLNYRHFGSVFTTAYADQPEGVKFSTPLLAGLYGYFFSIGKSLLLFSPALLLGFFGWRAFWERQLELAFGAMLAIVLLLLFHARWQNWAGGWCWGPRHVFMLHVFAILPVMEFVRDWTRARKIAYACVMVPAFVVQLYGSSQSFIDFYVLYYRTPEAPPNAYVMYSPEDLEPRLSLAPINDSIYVPQNSQWYRYAEMWDLGYTDNLWLRWWKRAHGRERPVAEQLGI